MRVELIDDLPAKQCFKRILKRNDTDGFAVFIDDDEEMMMSGEECCQRLFKSVIFPDVVVSGVILPI